MFSEMVEECAMLMAMVRDQENVHLTFKYSFVSESKIDQSISHNDVRLTVTSMTDDTHTVTMMKETLDRSDLGLLEVGGEVNMERNMMINGCLDGHVVRGHIDQTVTCIGIEGAEGSCYFTFQYELGKETAEHGYITVDKGSVAVNGVSLTTYNPMDGTSQVAIIPYTFRRTNFHAFKKGSVINLEFGVIGKYISGMIQYKWVMDDFLQLVVSRQSDRTYDMSHAVEYGKLGRILEITRLSPSTCNAQPWCFVMVIGPELAVEVGEATAGLGMNKSAKGAPVRILVVGESIDITSFLGAKIKDKYSPLIDIGIAAAHITLTAEDEGLGSRTLGWFDEKEIKKLVGIPANKRLLLDITTGYPVKEKWKKSRKSQGEAVSHNHY